MPSSEEKRKKGAAPEGKKKKSNQEGAAQRNKTTKRESCMWRRKSKGECRVLLPLREIICVCVKVKKNKKDFFLVVRHTQELL